MRRLTGFLLLSLACVVATATPAVSADGQSLLQTIAEWQYPGSTLAESQVSDGETIDDSGNRTVPSGISRTDMTTDAPVDEVVSYYKAKLSPTPNAASRKGGALRSTGRSVVFSDDSAGRPFTLHTILVNTKDTSTTLIISRGKGEAKTHIAWKQYRRFDP